MVDDLSELWGQTEISIHFLIKKRPDACCSQSERLGSKIHSLTNRTRLEMHISISTIAVTPCSFLKITDHGKCQASIAGQVLSQAESCRYQALVPFLDYLQLCLFRPIAVNTLRQAFNTMNVKIQMDETSCPEIGEERLLCAREESRKLREGDQPVPTLEVKSGTPRTNDVAEAAACGDIGRQADFAAARYLRRAKRGGDSFRAELCGSVNCLDQRIGYLRFRQPVGLATKQNRLDLIQRPQGNRWAMKPDHQHRPLILTEETYFRHSIVTEITKRKALATYRSSSKGE